MMSEAALRKILLSLRRRFSGAKTQHLKNSQHIHVSNPWHAVGVVPEKDGCKPCVSLKGVRFLAREAPPLPLAGCSQPKSCKCVYKHFSDRRLGARRAAERLGFQPLHTARAAIAALENRRQLSGRRCTDGH